ncbi:hypothetical protein [Terrarubrum flagellatum]
MPGLGEALLVELLALRAGMIAARPGHAHRDRALHEIWSQK